MITLGRKEYREMKPMLLLTFGVGAAFSLLLLGLGAWLLLKGPSPDGKDDIDLSGLGVSLKTGNVGLALVVVGVAALFYLINRLWTQGQQLMAMPDESTRRGLPPAPPPATGGEPH